MNPANRQALRDFWAFLREDPIRIVRLAMIITTILAGLGFDVWIITLIAKAAL